MDIICPFCQETDFDLVGLKGHYEYGDCDQYSATTVMDRPFTTLFDGYAKGRREGLEEAIEGVQPLRNSQGCCGEVIRTSKERIRKLLGPRS